MPYGVLPVDTTRKPLSCERVTVNWEHPLNRGLVSCYLMNSGGGSKVEDLVNRNNGIYTGSPAWAITSAGHGLRADNDQYVIFPRTVHSLGLTGSLSVHWIGTPAQLSSTIRKFFLGQYHTDASYDWGLYVGTTYIIAFYIKNVSDAVVIVSSTSPLVVGTVVSVIAVYDGANLYLYWNGSLQGGPTAQTGNVHSDARPLRLGYTWDTGTYADIITNYLGVYTRSLSNEEVKQLWMYPYGTPDNPRLI